MIDENMINLSKREILTLNNFLTMYDERFLSKDLIEVRKKVGDAVKKFQTRNTLVLTKSHRSGSRYIENIKRRHKGFESTIERKNIGSSLEILIYYDDNVNIPDERIIIVPLTNNKLIDGFTLEKPHSDNPFLIDFKSFNDNEIELGILAIERIRMYQEECGNW